MSNTHRIALIVLIGLFGLIILSNQASVGFGLMILLIDAFVMVYFLSKPAAVDIDIVDEYGQMGGGGDGLTILDSKTPWRMVGDFSGGKIVEFSKDLDSDQKCPICRRKLLHADPYENSFQGWVCGRTECGMPHHLGCRRRMRKCFGACFKATD